MAQHWLRCDVRKGMFSDEKVVVIRTQTGEAASFFVPSERVEGPIDQEGRVRVRVFKENSRAWAVVPNENQTVVPVDESQLVAV